eukprot:4823957-Pyramimonas_sp.AAC.1
MASCTSLWGLIDQLASNITCLYARMHGSFKQKQSMIELPVPPRHVHNLVDTSVRPVKLQKPESSTSSGDLFQSPPAIHGPSTLSTTAPAAANSFALLP